MKKKLFAVGLVACAMAIGAKTAHAQQVSLDNAICGTAEALSAIGLGYCREK